MFSELFFNYSFSVIHLPLFMKYELSFLYASVDHFDLKLEVVGSFETWVLIY
jgi:hypothetical protein